MLIVIEIVTYMAIISPYETLTDKQTVSTHFDFTSLIWGEFCLMVTSTSNNPPQVEHVIGAHVVEKKSELQQHDQLQEQGGLDMQILRTNTKQ